MMAEKAVMRDLWREARKREGGMVRLLGRLVRCESPSGDKAAVDRCHALALEHQETYGIKKVMRVQVQHGDYAFYMCDLDDNWWEFVAYRGPRVTTADQTDLIATYDPSRFPRSDRHPGR